MSPDSFSIIDSTLREGEQFATAAFSTAEKIAIARLLDAFGVEYLELTSPLASDRSREDCCTIAGLGLRARILTHTRCHMDDARRVAGTGVDGVNVVIGTSPTLRRHSHGHDTDGIVERAIEVIGFLKSEGFEVRFSTEDSFRSDREELLAIYQAVDSAGVDRVGVADTVGVGTPGQVAALVGDVRRRVRADIEFHAHNDTGCAIANALAALEAGATHIDTSVLGIGERNGITPLGGFVARLYAIDRALVARYRLPLLAELDQFVADTVGVAIPFNNYVTGSASFSHKAGIHTKAVLANPSTYEVLDPEAFGVRRQIHIAHRLTGRNAVRHRAAELGLALSDERVRAVTAGIKSLADREHVTLEHLDALLTSAASELDEEGTHAAIDC